MVCEGFFEPISNISAVYLGWKLHVPEVNLCLYNDYPLVPALGETIFVLRAGWDLTGVMAQQ